MKPKRPLLRWHGGKFILSKWIIEHLPKHRIYVEPFAGAGSVLMQKERSYSEVLNDIDDNIYNLFWVMQNHSSELIDALKLTLFSRREFQMSYLNHPNPVEKARRLIIRSFQGFGTASASASDRATGFRACSNRSGSTPAHDWVNYANYLHQLVDRLRGVVIENRDCFEVLNQHDSNETCFYIDPPYVPETRKLVGAYRHEFDKHKELLASVKMLSGAVVISGYDNQLYNEELRGWKKVKKQAYADGARKRTEVLWLK